MIAILVENRKNIKHRGRLTKDHSARAAMAWPCPKKQNSAAAVVAGAREEEIDGR
jgi:hypothetical protein